MSTDSSFSNQGLSDSATLATVANQSADSGFKMTLALARRALLRFNL